MARPVQRVPSRQNLRNTMGLAREFGFLEFNTMDMVSWDDDFLGALDDGYVTAENNDGTVLTVGTGANGTATLVTDNNDNDYSEASLQLQWQPQLMCAVAARVQINNIATAKMEIGFTDQIASGADVSAILLNGVVADTYTANATDAAAWVYDTDSDSDVWHYVSTYNQNATDTITGAPVSATSYQSGAPVNDTYETFVVALEGTRSAGTTDAWTSPSVAHFYRFDKNGYQVDHQHLATGPTSNVLLTPYMNVTTRTTAVRTMTVDFFKAWQRRTAD